VALPEGCQQRGAVLPRTPWRGARTSHAASDGGGVTSQRAARPRRCVCTHARTHAHTHARPSAQHPAFLAANPGLAFDYQFIDVPDFNGQGESSPAPYYYQNLGEAE
jgi:hypothetical protein